MLVLPESFAPMSTSATAYSVYVLKRLGFERTRGAVDPETFGDLCRAVLEKHATDGYADPDLRRAAIAAANIAIAEVCSRLGDPAFDLGAALGEAEAALAAERTMVETRAADTRLAETRSAETRSAEARSAERLRATVAESGPVASAPMVAVASGPARPAAASEGAAPRDGDRPPASRVPSPDPAGAGRGERDRERERGARQAAPPRRGWITAAIVGTVAGGIAGFLGGFAAGNLSGAGGAPSLAAVAGDWTWMGGARVRFVENGSFTFNGRPAGHYFATSGRHFILVHENGRFVDYVTLDGDGQRLIGYSAAGVQISATRVR
jgi:hypothetical protein